MWKRVFVVLRALTLSSKPKKLLSGASRLSVIVVLALFLTSVYSITRGGTQPAQAAAPATLNFQGRLLSSSGNLVDDGLYNIEFKLYNAASSGTSSQGSCTGDANCLWTETRTGGAKVEVKNGYFSAYLGDVTSLPTNIWDQQLWLTMNIGGTSGPTWDGEMTPRIRLTSVPYAFQAKNAETLSKNTGSFTGTVDFATMTADRKFLFPDTSLATTASPGTICVFNGSVSNCPAATGSAYYIHNDTALQTDSNFNIQAKNDTGTGTDGTIVGIFQGAAGGQTVDLVQYKSSGGSVLGAVTAAGNLQVASSLDVRAAGTLSVGTSTATAITLGKAGVTTTNAGALTVTELATFNGGVSVASNLTVTQAGNVAFQRNTTDYTATGIQNDVNFGTGALFRITSASALTITSIANPADGRIITLANASSNVVTLQNDSGGTAANRIITGTGGSLAIPTGSTVQLAYDSSTQRWRVIGGTATAGGAANQQLSNLGTTSINSALTPNANNSLDLGSAANSWKTLYAETSVITATIDTEAAGALTIGGTNTSSINFGIGGSTKLTVTNAGDLQFAQGGARTLNVAQNTTSGGAGYQLTFAAGQANGSGSAAVGGTLALQGGAAAGTGNANGGDITLQGGAGVGTGVQGQVVLSVSRFTTSSTQSFGSGGGTVAQAAVDGFSVIPITVSGGSNPTVTLPAPTNTTPGRILYVTAAAGSATFSLAPSGGTSFLLSAGATATFMWSGTAWTNAGVDSGSASYILNQSGSAQTTANFWISGTGRADTGLISPSLKTADVVSGSSNSLDLTVKSGDVSSGSGNTSGAITIKTGDATASNNSSGNLTIDTGTKSGSGTTGTISIGTANTSGITIGKVGVATTNNGNLTVGASAGSGTTFTNNGATLNTVKAVLNDSDGGALGGTPGTPLTAAQSVDIYTSFTINQTSASQTITLPSPTNTAAGRIIYIANIGSASFGMLGSTLNAGATATLMWNGSVWTFAGADGTSINNQNAAQQSGNFWISGTGRADTSLQAPAFDTPTAAALSLGTANATNISIGHNAGTLAIDATNFDLSTAGVLTLIGGQTSDITTQANQNLTLQANGTGTISLNDTVSVTGNFTVANTGNVAFQRNTTDYTATGTQDSINFGTGVLFRITSASALTINGIAGGADGRVITLVNASANAVSIGNSTSATPANHVVTGTGGTLSVPAGSSVQLAYDSASSVWRVIGGTAVAGGGANQQLSNLSGTVAVNTSLLVGTSGLDLGATGGNGWRTLYADTSVLSPLVGRASSGTLSIGTDTNSTAVSISRTGVNTRIYGTLTVDEAAGFTSNLTVANTGNVAFQRNTTSYTVTGTQEITLGTGVLHRVTSATSTPILTGLTGGADGRIITLMNASGSTLTIQNDSGGTAANRIITGSGLNSIMPANGSIQLAYDSASSRWRIIGSSGGDSIQLQSTTPGTAQTGNFNVSGTGIAGTALYSPLFDTATAVALGIGTSNATNISIGHNGGTIAIDGTNFDLSTAGVLTLAGSQTSTGDINTAASGAGSSLTIKVGNSTNSGVAGGALTLQGGAATAGNANGGAVTIAGGAGFGTGTQGLVNLSTTAFSTSLVQTFGSPGVQGFNNPDNSIINAYSTIPVSASTTGVIISIPDPAQNVIGRIVYVAGRSGSSDFTIRMNASRTPIDIAMKQNSTATLIWNGTDWTAAGASSSTDLQSAYNNTLTSAGGAEILLNPVGGNADGFTIRNNGTTPIVGGLLEVQSSTGSNLLSVNNNATEYAVNGGAETSTGFSTNWQATPSGGSVGRDVSNYATGQSSVSVSTSATNHGARNILSTALSSGVSYAVSFTAKTDAAYSGFSGLQIVYSPDGTNTGTVTCASGQTVTKANWSRISCTFIASGSITSNNSVFIRQTDGTTRVFYIDNLSVQVNANMTFAADGSVSSSLGSNWGTYNGAAPASQSSTVYDGQYAVSVGVTGATQGVRNNMAVTPAASTQYLVTFYAKASTGTATIAAGFLPAGGNGAPAAAQQCVDYNTQSIPSTGWQRVTCIVTTSSSGISDPDLVIYQTDATTRTLYIDALTITLNTNNSNNVQVGGVNKGGPITLLTLDRAASAPIAANNDAYLGSMYYDTTTGRIQCYEADGWGACGSSPDNIITLTPEYAGAVLGGPGNGNSAGIGVMTSEFCSTESGVLTLGTLCATHEARNYYHWTSPQATEQVYSIYVTYKLPSTFKEFNDSNTIKLTALTDSTSNAIATLQVFRKPPTTAQNIASCGSATTINSTTGTWEQTSFGGDERACSFAAGDNIIFKIDMKSKSNGNIYVENLDFVYNNN